MFFLSSYNKKVRIPQTITNRFDPVALFCCPDWIQVVFWLCRMPQAAQRFNTGAKRHLRAELLPINRWQCRCKSKMMNDYCVSSLDCRRMAVGSPWFANLSTIKAKRRIFSGSRVIVSLYFSHPLESSSDRETETL